MPVADENAAHAESDAMMQLRGFLRELRPRIPQPLLAGAGWDRLLQRVGDLPAEVVTWLCGFEFRLDDPAPDSDFGVVVAPGSIARHFRDAGSSAAATFSEAWLAARLTDQPEPDTTMMLAYDITGVTQGHRAAPMVYFSFAAALPFGGNPFVPEQLADTLGPLLGGSEGDFACAALTRTFSSLPDGAALVYVGVAPDRAPPSIRLLVAEIPASRLEPFLDRIGWPGSIPAVLRLLSSMREVSERFMLMFDITATGALPRIGFEMYPKIPSMQGTHFRALLASGFTTTRADWSALVGHLVDQGWCLPTKAEALLSWPGQYRLLRDDEVGLLHMGINHVKLVMNGDRLSVKGYPGLRYRPLTPQSA